MVSWAIQPVSLGVSIVHLTGHTERSWIYEPR